MSALIHLLDTQSANQIAAGEVVERPVSVVKELIENALDAGARQIEVTIEGSGVELIRIRDDGQGISAEDLPRAVLRHATSKIRTIDDLNDLRTLGFRGEALPSIASVSKMEIVTRPKDEVSGMLLRLEGGEQVELKEAGCPPGTTVTIQDLFYNTPARRKFLKSTNTEFGLISDVIGRLALARPDVAFTLKHPKTVVIQTPGRGRLVDSIGAILGQTIARRVLPVVFARNDWKVEGYISPPDLVRSTRQGETLIVNGRIIRSALISRALSDGYHTLVPQKLYPIVVLNLQIPPHEYDVNVHPTKMEIRFHREKELSEFIAEGIRQTLLKARPVAPFEKASVRFGVESGANGASMHHLGDRTGERVGEKVNAPKPTQYALNFPPNHSRKLAAMTQVLKPHGDSGGSELGQDLSLKTGLNSGSSSDLGLGLGLNSDLSFTSSAGSGLDLAQAKAGVAADTQVPAGLAYAPADGLVPAPTRPASTQLDGLASESPQLELSLVTENVPEAPDVYEYNPSSFAAAAGIEVKEAAVVPSPVHPLLTLRVIGQLFTTYILTTDGEQLTIIDQHAAHERINYERLLAQHKANPGDSQALLIPITLEFSPGEEQALLEHLMVLHDMGFVLEQFGTRTYLLRGIPAYSGPYEGEKLLRDFLDKVLLQQDPPTFDQLLEEWIYMLACKASIRAKEHLSSFEMEQLIVQLSKTKNPYTCPHGRPTMLKFTRSELERRFYRT